jgi:hypothetical protein
VAGFDLDAALFQVAVDDAAERWWTAGDIEPGTGDAEKCFADELLHLDGRACGEAMIAGKKDAEGLVDEMAETSDRGCRLPCEETRRRSDLVRGRRRVEASFAWR